MDHSATTYTDPIVLQEMLPYFTEVFGNASSQHKAGRESLKAVDVARERIAKAIGCLPSEVYFTSGGSESDNWAIKGMAEMHKDKGNHIITTKIEPHPYFSRDGADVLVDVPVTVAEAALGGSVVIPAPDGSKVRVKVPAGTQSGTRLTVRGKGAPRVKGQGSGDLKIKVIVKVPEQLNDGQRRALEEFQAATSEDVRTW